MDVTGSLLVIGGVLPVGRVVQRDPIRQDGAVQIASSHKVGDGLFHLVRRCRRQTAGNPPSADSFNRICSSWVIRDISPDLDRDRSRLLGRGVHAANPVGTRSAFNSIRVPTRQSREDKGFRKGACRERGKINPPRHDHTRLLRCARALLRSVHRTPQVVAFCSHSSGGSQRAFQSFSGVYGIGSEAAVSRGAIAKVSARQAVFSDELV